MFHKNAICIQYFNVHCELTRHLLLKLVACNGVILTTGFFTALLCPFPSPWIGPHSDKWVLNCTKSLKLISAYCLLAEGFTSDEDSSDSCDSDPSDELIDNSKFFPFLCLSVCWLVCLSASLIGCLLCWVYLFGYLLGYLL